MATRTEYLYALLLTVGDVAWPLMRLFRLLPPLMRRHPNLVVASTATAFLHLTFGISHLIQPERYQDERYREVYHYVPEVIWGWKGIIIWTLMTYGAFRNQWAVVKAALGVGMFFALLRGLMIEMSGGNPGSGAILWVWVAMIHYVQIAEPARTVAYSKDEE